MLLYWPGVISHFADYLPVAPRTPELTLQEGNTPLIRSQHIVKQLKLKSLFFKFEGMNPTGSLSLIHISIYPSSRIFN